MAVPTGTESVKVPRRKEIHVRDHRELRFWKMVPWSDLVRAKPYRPANYIDVVASHKVAPPDWKPGMDLYLLQSDWLRLRAHYTKYEKRFKGRNWIAAAEKLDRMSFKIDQERHEGDPRTSVWGRASRKIHNAGKGLVGLFKAATGIERAVQAVIDARQAICDKCAQNQPCLLGAARCCGKLLQGDGEPGCGCIINQKVKVAGQVCPEGKW